MLPRQVLLLPASRSRAVTPNVFVGFKRLAQSVGSRFTDRILGFIERVANKVAESESEGAIRKKREAKRSAI